MPPTSRASFKAFHPLIGEGYSIILSSLRHSQQGGGQLLSAGGEGSQAAVYLIGGDGQLVKQAFLQRAALGSLTCSSFTHKSWAGQVGSFLSAMGMIYDLSSPQTMSVSAAVEKLQSSYLALVNACSGVKLQ